MQSDYKKTHKIVSIFYGHAVFAIAIFWFSLLDQF